MTWVKTPYFVLVNGLTRQPQTTINGKPAGLSGANQYLPKEGWLILQLQDQASMEIVL
jgi:hypothetical protein